MRRALPQRRKLHRPSGAEGLQGGHLRAVGGSGAGKGPGQAGHHPHCHPRHRGGKLHARREPQQLFRLRLRRGRALRPVFLRYFHRRVLRHRGRGRPGHGPRDLRAGALHALGGPARRRGLPLRHPHHGLAGAVELLRRSGRGGAVLRGGDGPVGGAPVRRVGTGSGPFRL